MGQVSVVQGPGLPFEGRLGLGADDQRRAADLLADAGQGVVQRGGEPGGREGRAKVNMPFCTARRVPVLALIRSQKTLSRPAGPHGSRWRLLAGSCRAAGLGAMKSQMPPVCIFAASFMLRTISKGAER